jgi:hypothetical protein
MLQALLPFHWVTAKTAPLLLQCQQTDIRACPEVIRHPAARLVHQCRLWCQAYTNERRLHLLSENTPFIGVPAPLLTAVIF